MPFIPLLLLGGGGLAGWSLFSAVDKTEDSLAKAATNVTTLLVVGGIAYLIAKKAKLI